MTERVQWTGEPAGAAAQVEDARVAWDSGVDDLRFSLRRKQRVEVDRAAVGGDHPRSGAAAVPLVAHPRNTARRVRTLRRARHGLLALNAVGATASAAFAVRGLRRPDYVQPSQPVTSLTSFWAASSAVRTWAVTVPLVGSVLLRARAAPTLLTVAGVVQLGDCALGVWQRKPGMTLAPAVMGLVHLASARWLSRWA